MKKTFQSLKKVLISLAVFGMLALFAWGVLTAFVFPVDEELKREVIARVNAASVDLSKHVCLNVNDPGCETKTLSKVLKLRSDFTVGFDLSYTDRLRSCLVNSRARSFSNDTDYQRNEPVNNPFSPIPNSAVRCSP